MCPRCGRPTPEAAICATCQHQPLKVAPIRSAFLFEGALRQAVHALKYRGGRSVVELLALRMAEAWSQNPLPSELLIPIPLHPEREVRRGYNQAALLARALGRCLDLPVASRALVRTRNTASQTQLNRAERRDNVTGAFVVQKGVELAGRRVTLVDDVATTGATLEACAAALWAEGTETVNAFTLARAP